MQRALERLDLGEDGVDDVDGVGAGALGHAEGDGGLLVAGGGGAAAVAGVAALAAPARPAAARSRRLLGAVDDGGDVAQVNGMAGVDADDHGADVAGVAEEGAGLEEGFGLAKAGSRLWSLAVGLLQHGHELGGAEAGGRRGGGIERTRTARRCRRSAWSRRPAART
jgi:hypothetical protein